MAQTGYTPISIYYSATSTNVPTAGNLVAGELAINTADGKLFYKDSSGVVQVIAGKGGAGVAGGSNTQVQYNSSGSLAGSANMTFNGTTLTTANDASISGLTVGKGGGANSAVLGVQAANSNSGSNFVAVGYQAGYNNTDSSGGVFIGYQAGKANTSGSRLIAIGTSALIANTTGGSNEAIGYATLQSNTTGSYNTAVGETALQANTTASNNTAVGYQALYNASTSSNNTALGYQAGYSHNGSAGSYENTFVGYQAGYSVTGAYASTMLGFQAGYSTTGIYNTFVGNSSGNAVTTGTKNTILGRYNGNQGSLDIRTSSNYIVLSDGDGNPRQIIDNNSNFLFGTSNTSATAGFGMKFLFSDPSNPLIKNVIQDSSGAYSTYNLYSTNAGAYRFYVTSTGVINATSTTISAISDQRLKENVRDLDFGLSKIIALQPRKFDWKEGKGLNKKDDVGFIAQEFETVFPNSVATSLAGEDGIEYKSVNHSELIPTLVKAIQELKAEVDSLKQQLGK